MFCKGLLLSLGGSEREGRRCGGEKVRKAAQAGSCFAHRRRGRRRAARAAEARSTGGLRSGTADENDDDPVGRRAAQRARRRGAVPAAEPLGGGR